MTPPDRHKHSMIIQRRSVLIVAILEKAYNTEKREEATLKKRHSEIPLLNRLDLGLFLDFNVQLALHYFTQQDEESNSDSTFVRIALGSQ